MSLISLKEHIERSGDQRSGERRSAEQPSTEKSPGYPGPGERRTAPAVAEASPAAARGSQSGGTLAATLYAYQEAVATMGAAAERAMPLVSKEFHKNLAALAVRLAPGASLDTIADVRTGVASELGEWSGNAARYIRDKADEVREIVMVVARTAQAVGERDHRYAGQFEEVTGRLRHIAGLENFAVVRRNLIESAAQLTACVTKMTEEGQRSMEQLQAQVEIYRHRLEEAERRASIDPLTGLANRGFAEEVLAERIQLGRPFCAILVDLNGFKQVNDSHGHAAGDDLLRQFATELRGQFAPSDTVGRWGGDEFIGILEGHLDQARKYHDRIDRWSFGDYSITAGSQTHKIALRGAVGVAEWNGSESARELIARADRELYDAKEHRPVPSS